MAICAGKPRHAGHRVAVAAVGRGITRPALPGIENGQAPRPRAVLAALAVEFGVQPERLGAGERQTAIE
jgi:plasmid stability protein